jgi:hypothetical protein
MTFAGLIEFPFCAAEALADGGQQQQRAIPTRAKA